MPLLPLGLFTRSLLFLPLLSLLLLRPPFLLRFGVAVLLCSRLVLCLSFILLPLTLEFLTILKLPLAPLLRVAVFLLALPFLVLTLALLLLLADLLLLFASLPVLTRAFLCQIPRFLCFPLFFLVLLRGLSLLPTLLLPCLFILSRIEPSGSLLLLFRLHGLIPRVAVAIKVGRSALLTPLALAGLCAGFRIATACDLFGVQPSPGLDIMHISELFARLCAQASPFLGVVRGVHESALLARGAIRISSVNGQLASDTSVTILLGVVPLFDTNMDRAVGMLAQLVRPLPLCVVVRAPALILFVVLATEILRVRGIGTELASDQVPGVLVLSFLEVALCSPCFPSADLGLGPPVDRGIRVPKFTLRGTHGSIPIAGVDSPFVVTEVAPTVVLILVLAVGAVHALTVQSHLFFSKSVPLRLGFAMPLFNLSILVAPTLAFGLQLSLSTPVFIHLLCGGFSPSAKIGELILARYTAALIFGALRSGHLLGSYMLINAFLCH